MGAPGRFDRTVSKLITNGTTETLVDLVVPGNVGFNIKAFANYVGQTAALGNITWRLLVNGLPRFPLHEVLDIIGDQAQPWEVADDRLVAMGGDRVQVTATNSGGVPYDAGARLVGEFTG